MHNFEKFVAIGFILFVTGLACGSVGDMPRVTGKPFGLDVPAMMFLLMAIPSVAAYRAGRNDARAS